MGTAIGRVIDWCVTGLPTPVARVDETAVVVDNWPDVDADGYVVIGRSGPDGGTAADGENAWCDLGGMRIEEIFSVPGFVEVVRPGPSQKPARDAAIALFDVVVAFVRADPTLGGALTRGRVAIASRIALEQTVDDDDTNAGGALRRAAISFELVCKNTYL